MKLTEQQKEIALRVVREYDPSVTELMIPGILEFAARFLAALPKPEPFGWFNPDQLEDPESFGIFVAFQKSYKDNTPIYDTPPQPDDVRNAERYRWLRDSENQVTEDDPCVSDSFFNSWFGEELDKVIDEMIARNAAIAAAKGEV